MGQVGSLKKKTERRPDYLYIYTYLDNPSHQIQESYTISKIFEFSLFYGAVAAERGFLFSSFT